MIQMLVVLEVMLEVMFEVMLHDHLAKASPRLQGACEKGRQWQLTLGLLNELSWGEVKSEDSPACFEVLFSSPHLSVKNLRMSQEERLLRRYSCLHSRNFDSPFIWKSTGDSPDMP